MVENAKIEKTQMGHFWNFQTMCLCHMLRIFVVKKDNKIMHFGIFALSHKVVKATSSQDEVLRLVIPHGKFI